MSNNQVRSCGRLSRRDLLCFAMAAPAACKAASGAVDRLARENMRFTEAYSAAPVCSSTRACIMTGNHPARHHMTTWHEAADAPPPQNSRVIPPKAVANLPLEEVTC